MVVGIGINVHQRDFPSGLATPATSLDLETGRRISPPSPPRRPAKISGARDLRACRSGGGQRRFSARVEQASTWIRGRNVEVHGPQACTGVTAGLDETRISARRNADGLVTVQTGGLRAAERLAASSSH